MDKIVQLIDLKQPNRWRYGVAGGRLVLTSKRFEYVSDRPVRVYIEPVETSTGTAYHLHDNGEVGKLAQERFRAAVGINLGQTLIYVRPPIAWKAGQFETFSAFDSLDDAIAGITCEAMIAWSWFKLQLSKQKQENS